MARYSYRDVCRRIQERVDASGKPLKEVQAAVAMSKDQWSRKAKPNETGTGGLKTSWTFEELSRVADYFGAGPGWPFIEWRDAERLRPSSTNGRAPTGTARKGK